MLVALLLAVTCALHAAPAQGRGADSFERLDTDQNGKIDADEFKGPDEAFERMDRNADGFITREELAGGAQGTQPPANRPGDGPRGNIDPAQRWQQMLDRFDTNADGKISSKEFSGPEKVLTFLDANSDGELTQDEVLEAANRRQNRTPRDPVEQWQRLLNRFDADQDGAISQEEWPGRAEKFVELDADGNGKLVQDEMPAPSAGRGGERPTPAEIVARHDADGDGKLSRDEWPFGAERFDRMDPEGDGFITEEDLANIAERGRDRPDPIHMFIGMMDTNGDGEVSDIEWSNFFKDADVNGNGMLGHDELMAKFMEARRPPADDGPAQAPPAPDENL